MRSVWLHGFAGGPLDWRDVQAAAGAPGVALTLPGHGPPPVPSFEAAVRAVANQLPDGKSTIVGYSLGGRIGLGVADRFPERVAHLVLIGAHFGLGDERARAERRAEDREAARRLRQDPVRFFAEWDERPLFAEACSVALERWRIRRSLLDAGALADTLEALSLGDMPLFEPVIGKVPITIVAGSEDKKFLSYFGQLQSRHVSPPLHVVGGAGHRVPIDAPTALGRTIAAALSGPPEG